ncbi:MAG: hypothetical protein Q9157_007671 [Trypethelium eluteriae]
MGPPMLSSPSGDRHPEQNINGGVAEQPTTNGSSAPAVGAAAVAQQPKVVQTAFIHKLYNFRRFPHGLPRFSFVGVQTRQRKLQTR